MISQVFFSITPIELPPLPSLTTLGIYAICALAVFLGFIVWTVFSLFAWRALQNKQQVVIPLRLASACNLETVFQLRVDLGDLRKKVAISCRAGRRRLPVKVIQQVSTVAETLPAPIGSKSPRSTQKNASLAANAKDARQKVQSANSIANVVANICGSLASILPGALKTPFRDVEMSIRQGQRVTRDAASNPARLAASTRSLKANVQRLDKTAGAPLAAAQRSSAEPVAETAHRIVTHSVQVVETYPFQPAETQTCRLAFRPRNPLRKLTGKYQIASQPVEVGAFPIAGALRVQSLAGDLDIAASPLGYIILASVLCIGVLAFNTWWALKLIQWLLEFLLHA